ncbi:MAG TPA: T9SS type A sorting domain-containing protein [Spirosoma sp.]|nr:T9SS type A sorting domain-containing protein [Spirosoma sp.]
MKTTFTASIAQAARRTVRLSLSLLILLSLNQAVAQTQQLSGQFNDFTYKVPQNIQLDNSSAAWADYDGDGLQDFLIFGERRTRENHIYLFHNTGNGWEDVTAKLIPELPKSGLKLGSVAWGDYDGDKRPDLILTGDYGYTSSYYYSALFHNTPDGFKDVTAEKLPGLPQLTHSMASWKDFNGDGWQDFVIFGAYKWLLAPIVCGHNEDGSPIICWDWGYFGDGRLYLNNGNATFTDVTRQWMPGWSNLAGSPVKPFYSGSVTWGDINKDGKLDLMMSGSIDDIAKGGDYSQKAYQLYINTDNQGFEKRDFPPSMGLRLGAGFSGASIAWRKSDEGQTDPYLITTGGGSQLFRWTGKDGDLGYEDVTTQLVPNLPQVNYSAVAWFDFNNDKRSDLFISGQSANGNISRLYLNTPTGFVDVTLQLLPFESQTAYQSVSVADYDKDGRLDLLLTGSGRTTIYHNGVTNNQLGGSEQALQLLMPQYDCQSGAFTFRTSGGDGSGSSAAPIEFMAPGITGWTKNPKHFVDRELRQAADAQPITLMARQNGQMVSYLWHIRAVCPVSPRLSSARARLGAGDTERGAAWRAAVYPNPVGEEFKVKIEGAQHQTLRLQLADLKGQVLVDKQVVVEQALHQERLGLGGAPVGMYLLRVSTAGQTRTLKVLKGH